MLGWVWWPESVQELRASLGETWLGVRSCRRACPCFIGVGPEPVVAPLWTSMPFLR